MPTAPYMLDGVRIPSVTTILGRFKESGGLIHWAWKLGIDGKDYRQERDSAASAGTLAHAMIEADLRGEEWQPAAEIESALLASATSGYESYVTWRNQSKLEVLDTEMHLVSTRHRFGGTPDAVGIVNSKLSVVDWKTSNSLYSDHLIQCVAYKHLWEENYPSEPITGGIHICRFSRDHADFEHRHFATELEQPWEAFLLMRRLYELTKQLKRRVR